MKFQSLATEDIVAALKSRGFTYRHRNGDGWLCFDGQFNTSAGAHRVQLRVPPQFDEPPHVQLASCPAAQVLPHLNPKGDLCYIAKGSLIFDWFNAVENTIACVARAEKVLSDVLSGKLIKDLEQEFFAYWGESAFCLYDFDQDLHKLSRGAVRAFINPVGETTLHVLLTDDRMRSNAKLKGTGWQAEGFEAGIISTTTSVPPYPNQKAWPPKTVNDVLTWQSQLSQGFARNLERLLLNAYSKKVNPIALVIVESPTIPYAFLVRFDDRQRAGRMRSLLPSLLKLPVLPLSVVRLDDRYITQRNLVGGKSLAGKRIVLVGCGTVGGYLADMLVKAGAGSSGGKLTLVDHDYLGPQNVGRHRLGLESLYKKKAQQMKAELVRSSPGANIWSVVDDAKTAEFGTVDLLIDATGEQALTEWLTWKYADQYPILACWVEGPGSAVRALLKAKPEHGCSRCLSQKPKSYEYRIFSDAPETILRGHGCESLYVPFPASASIQAAALAMEMVQSWLDDVATAPTLRSRALDLNRPVHFLNGNLLRTEGCLACSS